MSPAIIDGEVKRPLTDADLVLSILIAWGGEFVPNLYKLSGVMVHSRIADLRRRGHRIESKCFSKESGVKGDYRYRLVREDAP